jgi:hypothetical protein
VRLSLLLCLGFRLVAQEGMNCVKDMMVPTYTYIARRSPSGGDVQAVIKLGPDGKPEVETKSADADLALEVRRFLTHQATFNPVCHGKSIEMTFTFRLEGAPEAIPPVWVRFQPPNHFVIVSRPRAPDIH